MSLQSIRCHMENVERLLSERSSTGFSSQHLIINLDQESILCPKDVPTERSRLTLLDAAVLAGDKRLVGKLKSLGERSTLQFHAWDFLHAWTVFMDDRGAKRLEAAILAGIDLAAIRCDWEGAQLLPGAILGGQRKAAM